MSAFPGDSGWRTWADLTATIALTVGRTIDLDTGALGTGASGDLLDTGLGGVLAPFGSGAGVILTDTGATTFDQLTQANLAAIPFYGMPPIPDQALRGRSTMIVPTATWKWSVCP